ncbi:M60 family metallopeptidase [Streptomyces sp. NPDC056638]|uniref:M60 family metallopeptidase n=1 Tax=Streptomyces sp. NPDC056638 TaxID=3345887 RepID=UPI00367AB6D2
MPSGVGAYAWQGYNGFPHAYMDRLCTVAGLRTRRLGPFHELGHLHQQAAYQADQLTEVTVNVYSPAAQRTLGPGIQPAGGRPQDGAEPLPDGVTVTYGKPVGTEAGVDCTGSLPTVTGPSSGSCLSTASQTTGQGQQVTVTGIASAAAVSPTS